MHRRWRKLPKHIARKTGKSRELVQDAHRFEWLIFTSPNGVERFFDLFFKLYDDVRSIGGCREAGRFI